MFSLPTVASIGKLFFLRLGHDIWPRREIVNPMLAEATFSGSDAELALSKHVLTGGRKERLNEASLFSDSSPPEPSPPALSLVVLTQQGRLSGPTSALLATARSDCIRSTVVLSGAGRLHSRPWRITRLQEHRLPQAPRQAGAAHLSREL